ncbi:CatB-related O-acetyltransferase [uncultured Tateyamaria sp.]|uniref:CatB-related O-acetyltransferase n=1 Tax=uncultured Tateyamaria sp. TaxID=455651 RepID=UPI002634059D|nr:CatB-related O-acetyltransferase [uncultured Tateyamaria sp.]
MVDTADPLSAVKLNAEALMKAAGRRGRSPLAHVVLRLARVRWLRSRVLKFVLRLEGGEMFSLSYRDHLARTMDVEVGLYSYGGLLKPGALPPGSRVGAYCSFGTGITVRRRNHPIERATQHPFFYNAALGALYRDTIETDRENPISIGHDVWIGDGATILSGCRSVGNGAVIAAGAVVTKDVQPFEVVGGVPAKMLRLRFSGPIQTHIEAAAWWRHSPDILMRRPDLFLSEMTVEAAQALETWSNEVRV